MAELSREFDYKVDPMSFAQLVMPELWRRIEAAVYPLAHERGLTVARDQKAVKTDKGYPVGGISNLTWRARKGLGAGFTVELEHRPTNYLHVKVTAKAFYPIAYLVSVILGLAISYFWVPYLFSNWNTLMQNWLFLGLLVVMWVVFFLATYRIISSAILALGSSFAFGFVAGFAVGWGIGIVLGDRQHGGKIRPALQGVIRGLEQPSATPISP